MLDAIVVVNDNNLNNILIFLVKKLFKEIKTIYIIIEMVETEINNYINKKCYNCCHFKKENMELYKLNLPNKILNNIINYSMDEEDECTICQEWRDNQELIRCHLNLKRRHNRNVEDDIIIFLTVYEIPPYDYIKQFLKIPKKKYGMIDDILRMLCYSQEKGQDVKENIKLFIESKIFNVKNTVRDINSIIKMMYERSKTNQLNYYPVLKL